MVHSLDHGLDTLHGRIHGAQSLHGHSPDPGNHPGHAPEPCPADWSAWEQPSGFQVSKEVS